MLNWDNIQSYEQAYKLIKEELRKDKCSISYDMLIRLSNIKFPNLNGIIFKGSAVVEDAVKDFKENKEQIRILLEQVMTIKDKFSEKKKYIECYDEILDEFEEHLFLLDSIIATIDFLQEQNERRLKIAENNLKSAIRRDKDPEAYDAKLIRCGVKFKHGKVDSVTISNNQGASMVLSNEERKKIPKADSMVNGILGAIDYKE